MVVAVLPVGVRCNLQCGYCYEDPQRDAGNAGDGYDIASIKASVMREAGGPFLLFGGEPLLLRKEALRDLWAWGLDQYGSNVLQTNGSLIDDDHIEMFHRYKVRVGISVDGPEELNDARWHGTLEKTRAATRRTQQAIARLSTEGIPVSLIVILHRLNATANTIPRLTAWFGELAAKGVRRIGLHLLEVESEAGRAASACRMMRTSTHFCICASFRLSFPMSSSACCETLRVSFWETTQTRNASGGHATRILHRPCEAWAVTASAPSAAASSRTASMPCVTLRRVTNVT